MDPVKITQLVIQAQNGNSSAYAELIKHTQRFAFSTVYRIIGNTEDSKDIVQEGYLRAWTNIQKYNGTVTFQSWLFSILRNLSIDWSRKTKIRQSAINHHLTEVEVNHPGNVYEAAELNGLIQNWIVTLPETQQLVFVLRDQENLSIREVEEQTGLTESSIKSNLHLVRKKLAGYLRNKGYQTK